MYICRYTVINHLFFCIFVFFFRSLFGHVCNSSRQSDIISEVVEGLKCYFDKALGNILLYRFERQQYVELRKKVPEKLMSEVYGAEHLLRLFGKLLKKNELRIHLF